ncbi:transposase-like protein [Caballeronia udeis]|uniref:Transposase-like protein n=2 Tax=Caballeronia udeis TaxID=1232866 RepID=A0A158I7C0_9BURK|nr:transposase-like protein [Caballeronia udeis]
MGTMFEDLIDDDFWALIEPLIPTRPLSERRSAGRPRAPDRAVFCGIVFVLRSGISWPLLPKNLGYGTGQICCRRLLEWQEEGVWPSLQRVLVDELQRRGNADVANAIVDSLSVRAVLSGNKSAGTLRASKLVSKASADRKRATLRV